MKTNNSPYYLSISAELEKRVMENVLHLISKINNWNVCKIAVHTLYTYFTRKILIILKPEYNVFFGKWSGLEIT